MIFILIILVLVGIFLMVGAGKQGVNKAKSAAYLAGKHDEERKKQ